MIVSVKWDDLVAKEKEIVQEWRQEITRFGNTLKDDVRETVNQLEQTGQKTRRNLEQSAKRIKQNLLDQEQAIRDEARKQEKHLKEGVQKQGHAVKEQLDTWMEGAEAWTEDLRENLIDLLGLTPRSEVERLKKQVAALQRQGMRVRGMVQE